jgi:hypothetical protein
METLSKRFTVAARMPGSFLRSHMLEECGLAQAARVNILLVHVGNNLQSIVQSFALDRREPLPSWRPGEPLVLPQAARSRMMILHEVGAMPIEDQRRLLAWLEGAGRSVQIISTSAAPLIDAVDAGTFLDSLYYRLNVVYVDAANREHAH